MHPRGEQLYAGRDANGRPYMTVDEYSTVAAALNLFRLLNSYKETGRSTSSTRLAFGWIDTWWRDNVVQPRSKRLETSKDRRPHLAKQDWLLKSVRA